VVGFGFGDADDSFAAGETMAPRGEVGGVVEGRDLVLGWEVPLGVTRVAELLTKTAVPTRKTLGDCPAAMTGLLLIPPWIVFGSLLAVGAGFGRVGFGAADAGNGRSPEVLFLASALLRSSTISLLFLCVAIINGVDVDLYFT